MHLLVHQAQEPLLLLPLVVQLSTCLNPFFWYYMALLHEERNWISFTAWVPLLQGGTTGTAFWIQAALCTELIEKSTCFFKLKAHHSYTFFINTRISWKPSKKNAVCLHSHTSRFIIWCYQKSKNINPMAFSVFVQWICSWVFLQEAAVFGTAVGQYCSLLALIHIPYMFIYFISECYAVHHITYDTKT